MLSEKCLSKKKYIFEKLATSVIMHKHYTLSSCSFFIYSQLSTDDNLMI